MTKKKKWVPHVGGGGGDKDRGKTVHSAGLEMEKRKENHGITKKSGKPWNRRVRVPRD
jgi:hypothetical protein